MAQYWQQFSRVINRYGWLIFLMLCALIGYMVIWDRGLYSDDYAWYAKTLNERLASIATIKFRPLNHLFFAFLPIAGEFSARLIATALNAGVAILAGWLVLRLTRSTLGAFVTACVSLLPFLAHQAVLWWICYGYGIATLFALLSLHCLFSLSISKDNKLKRRYLWLSIASFVIAMLFLESVMSILLATPLLAITQPLKEHRSLRKAIRTIRWRDFRAIVLAVAVCLVFLAVAYFALYKPSSYTELRGEFDLSPQGVIQRVQSHWLPILSWLIDNPNFGGGINTEAFELGADQLSIGWVGSLLFLLALIGLGFLVAKWKPASEDQTVPPVTSILTIVTGLLLALCTYLLPGALIAGQIAEIRLLYVPAICLAIATGAIVALIMGFLRGHVRLWITRALIGFFGLWTLYSAVTMLGMSALYQARSQLDSRQMAQLIAQVPRKYLPAERPYYFIYQWSDDDSVFDYKTPMNNALFGVFETTWGLKSVLISHYREYTVQPIISHRWDPFLKITFEDSVLKVRGQAIPPDQAIVFGYQDGRIVLYKSLALVTADGQRQIVPLPIVQTLAEHGSSTLETLEVSAP